MTRDTPSDADMRAWLYDAPCHCTLSWVCAHCEETQEWFLAPGEGPPSANIPSKASSSPVETRRDVTAIHPLPQRPRRPTTLLGRFLALLGVSRG